LPLLDQSIATPASKQAIDDAEVLLKTMIVFQSRFAKQLVELHLHVPSSHELFQCLFQCRYLPSSFLRLFVVLRSPLIYTSLQVLKGLNENRDLVGPAGLCFCGFLRIKLLSDSVLVTGSHSLLSSNSSTITHIAFSPFLLPGSTDGSIPTPLLTAFQHELAATFFASTEKAATVDKPGLLSTFLVKLEPTDTNKEDLFFPFDLASCSLRDHFLCFSPHARLAIYRGILISLPREVAVSPFPLDIEYLRVLVPLLQGIGVLLC